MKKPMVEYQLGGVLVRYNPNGQHKPILCQVNQADLRLVRGVGWVVTKPHKYLHIPEIARAVEDMDRQLVLEML